MATKEQRVTKSLAERDSLLPIAEQRLARTALSRLARPVRLGKGRLLYLVGPAGCGKSVLIREFLRAHFSDVPTGQLAVVTASEFAAQLAEASDRDQIAVFQDRFRSASLFVCEDLHALQARPQSQQQLFLTIDELLAHGHDVIVSSVKLPGQLDGFSSSKLVNRFRGGTIVALGQPGEDSRAELLRYFAQQRKLTLLRDALALLAESLPVSPRELLGVITQLPERRRPLDRAVVEELLHRDVPSTSVTPQAVVRTVAAEFGVTWSALKSRRRAQSLVLPRQCAMWLCRKLSGTSFAKLGQFFERQHSSVLHACQRLDERLQQDPTLRQRLDRMQATLRPTPTTS
jgi:chromosomal replication initiator protein